MQEIAIKSVVWYARIISAAVNSDFQKMLQVLLQLLVFIFALLVDVKSEYKMLLLQ